MLVLARLKPACVCAMLLRCALIVLVRRPGDENLKPNQKLNVMLQRILRADYTFPKGKALRCVVHAVPLHPACCLLSAKRSSPGGLLCLCSDSVRDLIGRILVQDPAQRPTLQVRWYRLQAASSFPCSRHPRYFHVLCRKYKHIPGSCKASTRRHCSSMMPLLR